jgi:AcrR family transcriptional regulator
MHESGRRPVAPKSSAHTARGDIKVATRRTGLSTSDEDAASGKERRRLDPERTRQEILAAAREEFAEHGLSGARVDAIAARTNTVKRMIYYYFRSKEGLYLAVLEEAYADIRRFESGLDLHRYPPVEAIRRLIEFTFDYDEAHPDFIRLVATENALDARYIAKSTSIQALNRSAITMLREVLDRGKQEGVFRDDVDPVDVHLLISSFCFFRVSNRFTFGTLFGRDLSDPRLCALHKRMLTEAVLNAVTGRQKKGSRAAASAAA